jgi:CPA2 family monovalent cation:H+ antiporter-2
VGIEAVGLRFLQGLVVMAAVLGLGRFVMPFVLGQIVRTRIRELFVLGSLFACLATGLLTEMAGLSMALGAFLAGVVLAASEYRHQVLSEIASFRDVFNSLFFISIGMLLSVPFAAARAGEIAALSGAILVGKAAIVFLVARVLRFPTRTAVIAALGLCQIGEFSFVLIRAGESQGLLPAELYSLLIAAAVVTMLATPALMAVAPRLAERLVRRVGGEAEAGAEEAADAEGHVLIGGFGLNGRHLARVLEEGNIPYVVVDANGARVAEMQRAGKPVLYGDLTRVDILEAAGVERARIAVFALSDPAATRQAVLQARRLAPHLYIIVRGRQATEIDELVDCGADEVVAEELETSIEVVTRVLEHLRLPDNVVRNAARVLRVDQYRALRTPSQRTAISETMLEVLAAGAVQTVLLQSHHPLAGETIRDSELRGKTGATILAVLRGGKVLPNPDPDLRLEEGDTLVLVGSHAALEAALHRLEGASDADASK